jgi:serine/threonine protein kinase
VKVLDFGLAKLIEGPHTSSNDPQLTEVGVPYGTSTYAAPEQAQGLKADPFSLTIYSDYIRDLNYAGRLDEARTESLKLVELDPNFVRC